MMSLKIYFDAIFYSQLSFFFFFPKTKLLPLGIKSIHNFKVVVDINTRQYLECLIGYANMILSKKICKDS